MKTLRLLLLAHTFIALSFSATESPEATTEAQVKSYATPISGAVDILYAPSSFPHYSWSNDTTNSTRVNGFRVNFEWIPFGDMPYGKPVLGLGTGASWISALDIQAGRTSSLYVFPAESYLGYRLDYFKDQVLVPYGKMGMTFAYLQEETKVSDGKRLSHQTYLGFDLAAGAEIWLNFIDSKSARNLDSSTGINNVYLLVEYFKTRGLGARWANLTREEVRLGMRFEF